MMPENRSILFPHFRYSEASGACDGGIPVEKMILVKSAGHPGLLALASRLCPWSVWWGSSSARRPSPNLSKADPETQALNVGLWSCVSSQAKKAFFIYRFQWNQVYVHSVHCVDRKVLMNRKEEVTKTTGCRKTKNICISELSNSSSFKKGQDWEDKACADKQLSHWTHCEHIR